MKNKSICLSILDIDKAQWNTDFNMFARRTNDGKIFATDKARKYSLRKELELNGNNVLIQKHYNGNDVLSLSSIISTALNIKTVPKDKDKIKEAIIELYNKYIDLRIFGFILNPNKDFNYNSHGSFSVYLANDVSKDYVEEIIMDITSFKPSTEKETTATIGKQTIIDKGFLNYTICIQPNIYFKEAQRILGEKYNEKEVEQQFEKDKEEFFKALATDVSNSQSCSKNGVNNLFNIIIEMKDNKSTLNIMDLQNFKIDKNYYIDFLKTKNVLIKEKEKIKEILIYKYNSFDNNDLNNLIKDLENETIKVSIKNISF